MNTKYPSWNALLTLYALLLIQLFKKYFLQNNIATCRNKCITKTTRIRRQVSNTLMFKKSCARSICIIPTNMTWATICPRLITKNHSLRDEDIHTSEARNRSEMARER